MGDSQMTDSADRFEKWINGMSEEEFIDRIESDPSNGGFSDAQEEIALNIRQPADQSELEILEREQESSVQEVYDTRDLPENQRPIPRREIFQRVYDTRDLQTPPRYVKSAVITRQDAPVRIQSRTPIKVTSISHTLATIFTIGGRTIQQKVRPSPIRAPIKQPEKFTITLTRSARVVQALQRVLSFLRRARPTPPTGEA